MQIGRILSKNVDNEDGRDGGLLFTELLFLSTLYSLLLHWSHDLVQSLHLPNQSQSIQNGLALERVYESADETDSDQIVNRSVLLSDHLHCSEVSGGQP